MKPKLNDIISLNLRFLSDMTLRAQSRQTKVYIKHKNAQNLGELKHEPNIISIAVWQMGKPLIVKLGGHLKLFFINSSRQTTCQMTHDGLMHDFDW